MSNSLINNDNYESVFFKLLENEYGRNERKQILEEISRNPFYSFEWDCWQKAKLKDEAKQFADTYASFFNDIKSDAGLFVQQPKGRIIPFYIKISTVAASLFIAALLTLFFYGRKSNQISNAKDNIPAETEHKSPIYVQQDTVLQWNKKNRYRIRRNELVKTDADIKKPIQDSFPIAGEYAEPYGQMDVPKVKSHDTSLLNSEITIAEIPVYKRKFTVSPQQAIKQDMIVRLSDLESSNISLISLLDNKRITVVRKNKKLYIKLVEDNEVTILLSLK